MVAVCIQIFVDLFLKLSRKTFLHILSCNFMLIILYVYDVNRSFLFAYVSKQVSRVPNSKIALRENQYTHSVDQVSSTV